VDGWGVEVTDGQLAGSISFLQAAAATAAAADSEMQCYAVNAQHYMSTLFAQQDWQLCQLPAQ
jgi:hypothetical protein